MAGPIQQDWEPVVVRKKAPNAAAKRDEKAVNEARRAGGPIETVKKCFIPYELYRFVFQDLNQVLADSTACMSDNAGSNKSSTSTPGFNTKKLDEETEVLSHDKVSSDLKKAIIQARADKKLTQAQLAQQINEKPQVVQDYESGKAIPNQQIISKLERVLGTKLRGKK